MPVDPVTRRTLLGAGVAGAFLAGCSGGDAEPADTAAPTSTATGDGSGTAAPSSAAPDVEVLLTNLEVPWDLAFLPDGTALLTLRDSGEVRRVAADGRSATSLGRVPGVVAEGEGGLLGVAPSPAYDSDRTVFLYHTAAEDNRVVRARLDGDRLTGFTTVLEGIGRNTFHNGGRIAFGPDGFLYVGTGDAGDGAHAQDRGSLNGKILRVTTDGAAAPGNPFGNRTWTYGHRNVQGLAWTGDRQLYASEFGQNTWDELNRIEAGRNYGWPGVEGFGDDDRYANPVAVWHTEDASPSGIAVDPDGAVWMAALRGQALWRIEVDGTDERAPTPQRFLHEEYGRLRHVVRAPDDTLWVLTSNTFRGTPAADDDRLLRVSPG